MFKATNQELMRGTEVLVEDNTVLKAELGEMDDDMHKIFKEVGNQQERVNAIVSKKNGFIKPEDTCNHSFCRKEMWDINKHKCEKDEYEYLINWAIGQSSAFTVRWKQIHITLSVLSSYFYCYIIINYEHALQSWEYVFLLFFDVYFLTDIIRKFLTEYTHEGDRFPTKDLKKIAWNYITTELPIDFLCWIPLNFIFEPVLGYESRELLVIKMLRLYIAQKEFRVFRYQ